MPDSTECAPIPSSAIPVGLFRQIMLWPLALHPRSSGAGAASVHGEITKVVDILTAAAKAAPDTPWQPVDDPAAHIGPPPGGDQAGWRAACYAEGVYFHEFVQGFLFSERRPREAGSGLDDVPFRLFRRSDIVAVDVTLGEWAEDAEARALHLAVERLNLYLFRTGAAILVVETVHDRRTAQRELMLDEVQDFHDQFRRVYVPFAGPDHQPPGLVVRKVVWHQAGGALPPFEIDADVVKAMIHGYVPGPMDRHAILAGRTPPLFDHWRCLLPEGLALANTVQQSGSGQASWRHVVDERMPTITTVSVTSLDQDYPTRDPLCFYNATSRGDLMRLCFADGAGSPSTLPYDRRSLVDFEKDHLHEAFRDRGTLYMASGFAFVAYGAGRDFDTHVAAHHMRRHYFQLGLLAHLELACLLSFSSRISAVVMDYHPSRDDETKLEDGMRSIQAEYLQFLHRFRFTGASNHVQAQAITDLWRRHLRLPEIFKDLHEEITSATSYLFNRAASRGAKTVERLQVFGILGLMLALTFGFLSANLQVYGQWLGFAFHALHQSLQPGSGKTVWANGPHLVRPLVPLALGMAVFATLGWVGLKLLDRRELSKRMDRPCRRPRSHADKPRLTTDQWIIKGLLWASLALWGVVLILAAYWGFSTSWGFQ